MTVPYGDTSLTQRRKNAFDVGEYGLGMCANALELGCDCLGEIYYFDSTVISAQGDLDPRNNVICLHEEDAGILWKHYDQRTDKTEVRRSRRLVISSIATIGNYEYGFYWYFYQDGIHRTRGQGDRNRPDRSAPRRRDQPARSEARTRTCTRRTTSTSSASASTRRSTAIENRVTEVNTQPTRWGRTTHTETRSTRSRTTFDTELDAIRELNLETAPLMAGRVTRRRTNAIGGRPRVPARAGRELPALSPSQGHRSPGARAYMYHHLWVTPWSERRKVPRRHVPEPEPGDDGLRRWTAADRNIQRHRCRRLVHPRSPPRRPSRGLAGHAGGSDGVRAEAVGFFTQNPPSTSPLPRDNGCHTCQEPIVARRETSRVRSLDDLAQAP